jgi:hypothetical protein
MGYFVAAPLCVLLKAYFGHVLWFFPHDMHGAVPKHDMYLHDIFTLQCRRSLMNILVALVSSIEIACCACPEPLHNALYTRILSLPTGRTIRRKPRRLHAILTVIDVHQLHVNDHDLESACAPPRHQATWSAVHISRSSSSQPYMQRTNGRPTRGNTAPRAHAASSQLRPAN